MRRFVLVSGPRTGSHHLAGLLDGHPGLRIHGELFNLSAMAPELRRRVLEDPVAYLDRHLGEPSSEDVEATGFRLFYFHASRAQLDPACLPDRLAENATPAQRKRIADLHAAVREGFDAEALAARLEAVWRRLSEDAQVRVIHLRRNPLEALVSLLRAFETDVWTVRREDPAPEACGGSLALAPELCREWFEQTEAWEAECDGRFAGHERIDIHYDALVADPAREVARACRLLGVSPPAKLISPWRRQALDPPSRTVAGFDALRAYFRETRWWRYFESAP